MSPLYFLWCTQIIVCVVTSGLLENNGPMRKYQRWPQSRDYHLCSLLAWLFRRCTIALALAGAARTARLLLLLFFLRIGSGFGGSVLGLSRFGASGSRDGT